MIFIMSFEWYLNRLNQNVLLYHVLEWVLEESKLFCFGKKLMNRFTYLWKDKHVKEYKSPKEVPAYVYINFAYQKIEKYLDDKKIFPDTFTSKRIIWFLFISILGNTQSKKFNHTVKKIFKLIMRIYCHILKDHFKHIQQLGLEAHLTTSLKHFILVCI